MRGGNMPAKKQKAKDESSRKMSLGFLLLLIIITATAVFTVTGLLISIFQHKQEQLNPFFRVVELKDDTVDPEIWGKNFPQQYDMYKRTVDMERTRYGGSEAMPRIPTKVDPRTKVAASRLDADPRLKIIWAGYSFAVDYREKRGHAYMLDDQTFTERQRVAKQPGTCLNCHASMYTVYKKLGGGDIFKGFEKINPMPYSEARKLAKFPVACIDCHDPNTMSLRITRPAFIEGIKALKESQGIKDYDVNTMATRQEMRSFVCAQCHVEYYFKGPEKRLVYPWAKGNRADQILAYYDESGFNDWEHKLTGAKALKAQHPEFEMWSQGIHSRAGVACADCHMPYIRIGALKISDHNVRSPLLNISRACQTCHRATEKELLERATRIQDTNNEVRNIAMDAIVDLIKKIEAARIKGIDSASLAKAQDFQRKAQFLIDFVESENSMGFHAPQEAARILALSLNYSRKGIETIGYR
jgi:nitrite reductase (cytochrome c-552)